MKLDDDLNQECFSAQPVIIFKNLQTLHGFQVFRRIQWVQRVLGHQQVQRLQQIQAHHGLPGEESRTGVRGTDVQVHVCMFVDEWHKRHERAELERCYLDSSNTRASRGSIVTSVALEREEHWL